MESNDHVAHVRGTGTNNESPATMNVTENGNSATVPEEMETDIVKDLDVATSAKGSQDKDSGHGDPEDMEEEDNQLEEEEEENEAIEHEVENEDDNVEEEDEPVEEQNEEVEEEDSEPISETVKDTLVDHAQDLGAENLKERGEECVEPAVVEEDGNDESNEPEDEEEEPLETDDKVEEKNNEGSDDLEEAESEGVLKEKSDISESEELTDSKSTSDKDEHLEVQSEKDVVSPSESIENAIVEDDCLKNEPHGEKVSDEREENLAEDTDESKAKENSDSVDEGDDKNVKAPAVSLDNSVAAEHTLVKDNSIKPEEVTTVDEDDSVIQICSIESINSTPKNKPVEKSDSVRLSQRSSSTESKKVEDALCKDVTKSNTKETNSINTENKKGESEQSSVDKSNNLSSRATPLELNSEKSSEPSAKDTDKMDVETASEIKQEADVENSSSGVPSVPATCVSSADADKSSKSVPPVPPTCVSSAKPTDDDVTIKEEAGSPLASSTETPTSNDKGKDSLSQNTDSTDTTVKTSDKSVAANTVINVDDEKMDTVDQNAADKKDDDASSTSNSIPTDDLADPEAQKKSSSSSSRTCAECGAAKGLKYQVLFQGKTRFLCSDLCFKVFRGKQNLAPPPPSQGGSKTADSCGICNREIKNGQGYFPFSGDSKPVCSEECMVKYQQAHTPKPCCAQCQTLIESRTKCLTWETMEFCNEDCLGIYQSTMGSHCACCKAAVQRLSLGKYCVRFGADIRQFCTGKCLEEFKKGLKVCTFCQKDMSNTAEGFLGPVGDKFRDFCTSKCMEQYEALNEVTSSRPHAQKCSVCQKMAPAKVQVKHKDQEHILCSDPCIAAFRYTQKIYATLCDTCNKFFNNEPSCLQIDNTSKKFCTKTCLNLFVLSHRKIVPCTWCKVKKYNFDMIERVDNSNNSQLFCSLNCLSLFRVSLNATSSRCVNCDHCRLHLPAQYHLTMSDASIRNFCSYPCVIKFQGQFTSVPTLTTVTPSLNRQQGPTPVGKATLAPPLGNTNTKNGNSQSPVIANVMSLAPVTSLPAQTGNVLVQKTQPQSSPVLASAPVTKTLANVGTSSGISSSTTNGMPVVREVHREVIVAPPVPRMVKNKMIMCKPLVQNKGVACKPHPCHKETQTEDFHGTPTIIPLPIPIFVPVPVHMYSRNVPFPMPFPIPIPVPIFIPTTRTTTAKVIKDIFDIQEKVPSNPFEAELLLMAEMVAAEDEKNAPVDEDEEMSLDEELKDIKDVDKKEAPELPEEPLQDLETAVPLLPPVIEKSVSPDPMIDERLLHPVVQLTQLPSNYNTLNETYSEESQSSAAELKRKAPVISHTSKRGAGKRGRGGRGRGRGRKRPRMVDSDDTSDEEWLPTDTLVEIIPIIPFTPVTLPKDSPKTPIIVPPKAVVALPITPKTPIVVNKPPVLSPMPTTPVAINATTTTSPLVVAVSKLDVKAVVGDGVSPDAHLCLKYMFGANAWKHWVVQKNIQLEKGSQTRRLKLFKTDLLQMSPDELNYALCLFVKEVRKPNLEEYAPDSIYYLCLGIQLFLFENGRVDNIFTDSYYEKFTECLNDVLLKHDIIGTLRKEAHFVSRIEEEILWESKQLGAHSPQVLLNTLMYFNTKQFHLQSVDDHLQLSFTYIMKGWRKFNNHNVGGSTNKITRCAVLRYYPPPARGIPDNKKAWREDAFTYEQEENFDNPLRCPVKLYEFYLSKCPESIRTRNDLFYMCPERSCVPDSPVWYSTQALAKDTMVKMLQRIYLVREISVPGLETGASALPAATKENPEKLD